MTDHVVGKEGLAIFIPIEAPGIGRSIRHHFEDVANRVIAPDAAIELNALLIRCPWAAYQRRRGDTVPTVKPTIRPPGQAVHEIVPGLERKSVQVWHGGTIRHVIAILIGNE